MTGVSHTPLLHAVEVHTPQQVQDLAHVEVVQAQPRWLKKVCEPNKLELMCIGRCSRLQARYCMLGFNQKTEISPGEHGMEKRVGK